MYKTFEHGGKEYRLEYSLEAYMTKYVDPYGNYKTHVAPLVEYMNKMNASGEDADTVSAAFDIPEIAVHAMFAGLIRWHGRGKRGDKSIITFDDAAEFCMELIDEHPGDKYLGSFSGLMLMCIEQIEADGFFNRLAGATVPEDKKPKQKKKAE